MAELLLADAAGDARKVPAEQMEPLLASLASDAYAQTMEQYFGFLLTGSDTAVRERVMADLRATPKETVVGSFRAHSEYDPLLALQRYDGPKLAVTRRSISDWAEPCRGTKQGSRRCHQKHADMP